MKKIKFAVVGCGRISKNHFEALKKHSELAEIISVCDKNKSRAQEKAEEYNISSHYTNIEEMLKNEEIDALSICTPSGLHPEHGIMGAQYGKHIICEKPMGTSLNMADKLIKECDKNKIKLFVVKQNRLNTTLKLVKKAIEKDRFGKIYMATCNVFWTRPQDYYNQAKWRGTWEFDGGAFMNQASHYVDMMEWMIGPVENVMAYTGTLERKIETEDTGVAIMKFRNGVFGSMNVTMLTYPKNYEGSLTIIGEKGTVKVGGTSVNKIEHWEFKDYDDDDKLIEEVNYTPPNVYGYGHTGYYENVIDVLNGKASADIDGREGRKSLELILAIYKSAKEGKKIALPLDMV